MNGAHLIRCELMRALVALIGVSLLAALATACGGTASTRSVNHSGDTRPHSGTRPPGLRWMDEEPAWSPDGREIVFASDRANPKNVVHLYVMKANGTDVRRVTRDEFDESDPTFSPNGREIAYAGHVLRGNKKYGSINVVPPAGGRIRSLTRNLRGEKQRPLWSPDGRWIAFISWVSDWRRDLYLVRPDGSDLHRLVINSDGPYAWSPDSREIAVTGTDKQIHRLDASRRRPLRVSERPDAFWYSADIAWSPDGSRIAYLQGTFPDYGDAATSPSLWVVDVGTGRSRVVRSVIPCLPFAATTTAWLHGKTPRLAVCAEDDKHIVILDADGHKLTSITADAGNVSLGSGSPDGRKLLFTAGGSYTGQGYFEGDVSAVFVVDVQNHRSRQLTQR